MTRPEAPPQDPHSMLKEIPTCKALPSFKTELRSQEGVDAVLQDVNTVRWYKAQQYQETESTRCYYHIYYILV